MPKNYENNPEVALYIKQNLYQKYAQIFQKYEISQDSGLQVCNLAEFFIKEHPEKYDQTAGTRMDYENSEDLKRVYVIIHAEKNQAILINTNPEGKIPEGEFGVYDLQEHKFQLTNEELKKRIERQLKNKIQKYARDVFSSQEFHEMLEEMMPKTLDDIDKLTTKGDRQIDEKAEKLVKYEKPDEINRRNGKTEEERRSLENKNRVIAGQESEKVPKDVEKVCKKFHITRLKSYFYVEAGELEQKIDGTRVNKNGNRVLMLEVEDSSRLEGPNKYYGVQDEQMVLYGTQNQEVRDVTGNVTHMGKVVKPLCLQSPEYIEYKDSEGLVIREQIDERSDLSVQEMERYREEMEEILEKYSQNIYLIKYNSQLSPEEKIEQIQKIDDWCDKTTTESAKKNHISQNDDKNIDQMTDIHTEKVQEEIEQG